MSKLTKCDICENTYNEDTVPAAVSNVRIVKYFYTTGGREDEDIDFCPKCTIKLREFIKGLKTTVDALNKE